MSNISETSRVTITDIEAPVEELTNAEASTVKGGLLGVLLGAWSILGQNYANGDEGWLTKLGNKIGDDWAAAFPKEQKNTQSGGSSAGPYFGFRIHP